MSETERWQLAGRGPEIYAEYLVPAIFGPWAPIVLDAARLEQGQSVLDVACGTGVIATGAESRVGPTGSVTGLDNNPGMLAVASTRSGTGVSWREGDAQALPFPAGSFDRVICQLGLQYFPDRPAAVREMRRVLRPGGRVVVMVWRDVRHSPGYVALIEALETHVGPEAATVMRLPFVFGDEPGSLASLLEEAGFVDVTIQAKSGMVEFGSVAEFTRYQVAGSPLVAHVDVHDARLLAALTEDVAVALGSPATTDPIRFPIQAHLGQARRNGSGQPSDQREPLA
jgi:SAM-dependent methyltransferase